MKPKRNTGMVAIPLPRITLRFIRATDELSFNLLSFLSFNKTVSFDFGRQACFIRFIGTHNQYDEINAEIV